MAKLSTLSVKKITCFAWTFCTIIIFGDS